MEVGLQKWSQRECYFVIILEFILFPWAPTLFYLYVFKINEEEKEEEKEEKEEEEEEELLQYPQLEVIEAEAGALVLKGGKNISPRLFLTHFVHFH